MLVPVFVGCVSQLGGQHRAASFRQEQQTETGADDGVRLARTDPFPKAAQLCLIANQKVGRLAIPIVPIDEPLVGEPADALHAIEVVQDMKRVAGIGLYAEVFGQPLTAAQDRVVGRLTAAALYDIPFGRRVARIEFFRGHDQRGYPGASHAACSALPGRVPPRAIGVLRFAPMFAGEPPCLFTCRHADSLGFVQCQQCELRVRVVSFSLRAGVSPGAVRARLALLDALEIRHVAANEE